MIADLRPYPAMRDSGVPWLGEVPEHWETRPLKRWVTMNAEVLPETTDPERVFRYLEIGSVGTGFLTQKPQRVSFGDAPSRARRVVHTGDTIVSTVRTYLKAIYFVYEGADELICSTGFAVLTPRSGTLPKFVSYLVQSGPFTDRVTADSLGIAYPAIPETRLGSFHIAVPSLSEQAAIVRFLDHADRRSRRYIRAKQRLIKLLEEQKQAIIHRAVTRGLDPNVRLKPSGVEWLGDVPEHWEVKPLKFLCVRIQNGATPPTSELSFYENGTVPWYGPSSCGPEEQVDEPVRYLSDAALSSGRARLIHGPALLVVVIGATAGRMSLLMQAGATNQQITSYELREDRLNPRFVLSQLRGAQHWLRSTASTATIPILDGGEVSRLSVGMPSLEEQEGVMRHVDEATADLRAAIGRAHNEIDLLREYRTRLIADVVTGKLDVREAVARLPDEPEETAAFDEPGVLTDAEDAAADDLDPELEEAEA